VTGTVWQRRPAGQRRWVTSSETSSQWSFERSTRALSQG